MKPGTKKFNFLVIIIPAIIIFLILSIIKWPHSIKSPGKITAQKEWSLVEVEAGKLVTKLIDNQHSQTNAFKLLQFDNDDFFEFKLASQIKSGQQIKKNEIIANLTSSENRLRLTSLTGKLERSKANLVVLQKGKKKAVQEEAQKELDYAKTERDLYEPVLNRNRELRQKNLISAQELETFENNFRLLQLNVSIAEAELKTVQTGAAPAEINVLKTKTAEIEQRIEALRTKLAAEEIRSPIEGMVIDSYLETELCKVAKIDTIIIQIPVDEQKIGYIDIDNSFEVIVPALHNKGRFTGKIKAIGKSSIVVSESVKFLVLGQIINTDNMLLPGMTGYVKINCGKLSLLNTLKNTWRVAQGNIFFN